MTHYTKCVDILPLTQRELQILRYLMDGYRYDDIACSLNIKRNTVMTHIINIRHKLRSETNAQAVAVAISSGIMQID